MLNFANLDQIIMDNNKILNLINRPLGLFNSDIIKFESSDFVPVPVEWDISIVNAPIRNNAVDGSIKIATITDRGVGVGTANRTYTGVPIRGDGDGAECTIIVDADQQVESVTISNQGSGYTYGNVDLIAGGVPTGTTRPTFDVIISYLF